MEEKARPWHIAVYGNYGNHDETAFYEFYAVRNKDSARERINSKLSYPRKPGVFRRIAIKRMPDFFNEDMQMQLHISRVNSIAVPFPHKYASDDMKNSVLLGHINYNLFHYSRGITAQTKAVYPKKFVDSHGFKGMGSYLEAISIKHLQRQGIEKIITTPLQDIGRKKQLKEANLPEDEEVPISEWLKGLGRGIRRSILKNKGLIGKEEIERNKSFFARLKYRLLQKIK